MSHSNEGKEERNIRICRMRRAGKTQKYIADQFGITRPRVWQIIKKEIRKARRARPDLFENEDWENVNSRESMQQALIILQRMGI